MYRGVPISISFYAAVLTCMFWYIYTSIYNVKARSHGIRKKDNAKRKRCAAMKLNTSLNDLAVKIRIHGRYHMLSCLSSLPIAVLRSLDTEANRVYDRKHQMYDAALLTRCYTQTCSSSI